jgi:hypothetical protein
LTICQTFFSQFDYLPQENRFVRVMQHIDVNFGASTHDIFDVPPRLAVKSNGAEKPKTHDFSDVSRLLGVMNIAEEKSEDESLALFIYQ